MVEVNAVFEGGGVKGIALVGALARAQQETITIKGYAGASAGAIVAAFACVGYSSDELKQILEKTNYLNFLDGNFEVPLPDLRRLIDEISNDIRNGTWEAAVRDFGLTMEGMELKCFSRIRTACALVKLYRKHKNTLEKYEAKLPLLKKLVSTVFKEYGVYDTKTFLSWLQDCLNAKGERDKNSNQVTFGTIFKSRSKHLKILAADVGAHAPFLYSYDSTADLEVAQAIQASMSIPFFFRPFAWGKKFQVDGGTISNFPAWVFDEDLDDANTSSSVLPVLGFRLVPEANPYQGISGFAEFGTGVIQTIMGGTDLLQTRKILKLGLIEIPIPSRFRAVDFDLTSEDSEELYFRGLQVADTFFKNQANRERLGLPIEPEGTES